MSPEAPAWNLRAARAPDGDVVLSILRAANLPTEGVEDRFPAGYIVAESGGGVIAAGGLEPYGPFGLLRSLAVLPEWRGRGVGRALAERLLGMAGCMGMEAVYLLTTTAQEYFHGMGFRRVDRKDVPPGVRASAEFAGACPVSAVCMQKRLRGPEDP